MLMTTEELDAIVEAKLADQLAARLRADRERVRLEVIMEIRRKAEREWYDRINAKHPIEDKYGGLGPEGHAARLKAMDAARVADKEWHDRVNARPVEGSLLEQRSRADSAGGSAGFEIRPGRRS
jgi:hypothetical protein